MGEEPDSRVFSTPFNCTEVEVINRQPAGVMDVFLNVVFSGSLDVDGA
jgi:hypothetical protein